MQILGVLKKFFSTEEKLPEKDEIQMEAVESYEKIGRIERIIQKQNKKEELIDFDLLNEQDFRVIYQKITENEEMKKEINELLKK